MMDGLIAGTLIAPAELRMGKNGSRFALGKVKATCGDGEQLVVNVIAFADQPRTALLALEEGDALSLAGALTPKVWVDKQGVARPALDMVASQVMTAYQAARKYEQH